MMMETQQIKQFIIQELPGLLRQDNELQQFILSLARPEFADKAETESRFDRVLNELRRDREEQSRRWWENQQALEHDRVENNRKWEEQNQKWWENQQALEHDRVENNRKWEEQNRKWWDNQQALERDRAENNRKWEEQNQKWEEQNQKWWENQQKIHRMLQSIEALSRKHDSTIGALGARWGLYTEESFRSALKGILEDWFTVQVIRVVEYDESGEVFGRPDQVELDLIVKDGLLILGEIKSSMSKADMVIFSRKASFYEKKHHCRASRLLVISPMVDRQAKVLADELGIQVYSYAEDVDPEVLTPKPADS
jgi:hypothetical protein